MPDAFSVFLYFLASNVSDSSTTDDFLVFIYIFGHTQQCPGLPSGPVLRNDLGETGGSDGDWRGRWG